MKRLLDLIGSILGLLILSPVMTALALAVRLQVGDRVFFTQDRPGLKGTIFRMWKFRSMRDLRDSDGCFLHDAERLTPLGKWMRKWSLDELPELINVLKGDMSFVGPRPLLPQYLERFTPEQSRRHEVKPGITGWAQVNGRNAITWEEKLAMDVWYVDNRSYWLDMKILGMTIRNVLSGEGINAPGEATMPEFMGTLSSEEKGKNA